MDELLRTAPCGFITFNDDGAIRAINEIVTGLLGYTLEDVQGRHLESILSAGGRIFYQTHVFPLLKLHGKAEELYLSLKTRNGGDLPVLASAARNEKRRQEPNTLVFLPMHRRLRYEEEIIQARKAAEAATVSKDEFLAAVSHELRTPLSAIVGWSRIIRNRGLEGAELVRALEIIERNATIQAQLISDILDLSSIVSGRFRLEVSQIYPAPAVEAAVDVVRPAADSKGIQLHAQLDPRAGPILGDPSRLQQIAWNLLSNAVKFTPPNGEIRVSVETIEDLVELRVSDTGSGISPEFLPYVFERYHQEEAAAKSNKGVGLGLAITRHLVELHGGSVGVESPGSGKGATFRVRLPLLHEEQTLEADTSDRDRVPSM